MQTRFFSALKVVFKYSFSVIIISYLVYSGNLDLSVVRKGFSNFPLLLISIFALMVAMSGAFLRWQILLEGQGLRLSFLEVVRYGMIGNFFNTALPGAVSGDVFKALYVIRDYKGQKKTPVLTSILLDRVMGVFGLVLVSASPVLLNSGHVWDVPALHQVATVTVILFAGVFLFFSYMMLSVWGPFAYLRKKMDVIGQYKIGAAALGAYDAWTSYRERPGTIIKAMALAVFTHLCVVTVVILCSRAIGEDSLALFQYFLLVPIGLLTTAVPIAPAGLGVGHVAFSALFNLAGSSRGAEVFTMLVTIQILLNLTGVFFFLKSPKVAMEKV